MTQQSVDRMHAKLLAPMQLLLEGVVLLANIGTAQTAVVGLTVANHSRVVLVL